MIQRLRNLTVLSIFLFLFCTVARHFVRLGPGYHQRDLSGGVFLGADYTHQKQMMKQQALMVVLCSHPVLAGRVAATLPCVWRMPTEVM